MKQFFNLKIVLPILVGVLLLGGLAGFWLIRRPNQIVINRREEVVIDEGINNVEIANQTKASLLTIYSPRGGSATGVVVTSDGVIAAAAASLPKETEFMTAVLADGKLAKMKFLAVDQKTGLAFLQIAEQNLPVARQAFARETRLGEPVLVIRASSISNTVRISKAVVSLSADPIPSLTRVYNLAEPNAQLLLDPVPSSDQVGAVVVNRDGAMIGLVSEINREVRVLRAEEYKTAIAKFLNQDKELTFQASYNIFSESLAELMGLPKKYGVLIKTATSGLLPGDFVYALDGAALSESAGFEEVISRKKGGDLVKINLLRTGAEREIEINL